MINHKILKYLAQKIIRLDNALVFLVSLSYFLCKAPLDPDVHHDGIIFTMALAIQNGLRPNLDFYSQYGPIAPVIDSYILKIFGSELINLRIFYAILLGITVTLTFNILKAKNRVIAFASITYWVLSSPNYLLSTVTPWPSIWMTLLTLIVIKLIDTQKTT